MRNLADKDEYEAIEYRLKEELLAWMEYCGDSGKKTEMDAKLHQIKRGDK